MRFFSEFYDSENTYFEIIAFTTVGVRIEKKTTTNTDDSTIFFAVQCLTTNEFWAGEKNYCKNITCIEYILHTNIYVHVRVYMFSENLYLMIQEHSKSIPQCEWIWILCYTTIGKHASVAHYTGKYVYTHTDDRHTITKI